ncbi:hypothetical protein J4450_06365 [Candidatus Micrarchaeota archaeon]|nr:hypothetical protein [Candidatus Micrarchaeota archaeon]
MKTVLLKNVPEEDWISFKTEAAAHNMKLAQFLSYVLRDHTEKTHVKERWARILSWRSGEGKATISKMAKKINKLRHSIKLER